MGSQVEGTRRSPLVCLEPALVCPWRPASRGPPPLQLCKARGRIAAPTVHTTALDVTAVTELDVTPENGRSVRTRL